MPDLEEIVERAVFRGASPGHTLAVDLPKLWRELGVLPGSHLAAVGDAEGLLVFMEAAHSLDRASGDQLELRPGGFIVSASGGTVKTALCAALLSGMLAITGVTALSPLVLPAVLPLLFDVERVRVTPGQNELLTDLVALPGVLGTPVSASELHKRLPRALKKEISRYELADFLDQLHEAGLADRRDNGYVLRGPGQARFRITWR
jgi:hypothetical protein